MGENLFQIVEGTEMTNSSGGCCSANPSEFTFMNNGIALARVGKSMHTPDECEITVYNSLNLDPRTKALLIFTGYLMVSNQRGKH